MRLGEHDLTERDGRHEDVRVIRGVAHESYSKALGINDIAVVYLVREVKYNGTFNKRSYSILTVGRNKT